MRGWQLTLVGFAIGPVLIVTMVVQSLLVAKCELRNKQVHEEVAQQKLVISITTLHIWHLGHVPSFPFHPVVILRVINSRLESSYTSETPSLLLTRTPSPIPVPRPTPLRRPQASPPLPLSSVHNIIMVQKGRSPSIDKSSQVSPTDTTPEEGFFNIWREAGRGFQQERASMDGLDTFRRSHPSHDQKVPGTRTGTSKCQNCIDPVREGLFSAFKTGWTCIANSQSWPVWWSPASTSRDVMGPTIHAGAPGATPLLSA